MKLPRAGQTIYLDAARSKCRVVCKLPNYANKHNVCGAYKLDDGVNSFDVMLFRDGKVSSVISRTPYTFTLTGNIFLKKSCIWHSSRRRSFNKYKANSAYRLAQSNERIHSLRTYLKSLESMSAEHRKLHESCIMCASGDSPNHTYSVPAELQDGRKVNLRLKSSVVDVLCSALSKDQHRALHKTEILKERDPSDQKLKYEIDFSKFGNIRILP